MKCIKKNKNEIKQLNASKQGEKENVLRHVKSYNLYFVKERF